MQQGRLVKLVYYKFTRDGIPMQPTIHTGTCSRLIAYHLAEPTGPRGPVAKEKKNGI